MDPEGEEGSLPIRYFQHRVLIELRVLLDVAALPELFNLIGVCPASSLKVSWPVLFEACQVILEQNGSRFDARVSLQRPPCLLYTSDAADE